MATIETFKVGQRYFQAHLLRNGCDVDNGDSACFDTREEAEEAGAELVDCADPAYSRRNPDAHEYYVREYEVAAVDEDGSFGAAHTVD